jgi:hypothetical protein
LYVVLYGCETWFLTVRDKEGFVVFENRVLRGLFGPKKEVVGGWRRPHNEERHNLYASRNIIRMICGICNISIDLKRRENSNNHFYGYFKQCRF